jgi:hypothetical protein
MDYVVAAFTGIVAAAVILRVRYLVRLIGWRGIVREMRWH